ncbi:BTAD domain-containing putative transcriptional regulator [Amycolatopsis sp. NPDC021455]|uniref:AfsR/SARP family transcriptional regulator n=1 Tax=Amycolatopsis sp. NPDC021455 TaxID=3154901 RepID=UPI003410EDD1
MRYSILGPLEVSDDGGRIALGGPQQRALLAVLLLNAGTVVSADRLVECLWGRQPPAAARSLLQGCVSGLRRALWPGSGRRPLVTRPPGYCLETGPDELDLDRFERLVAAANRTAAGDSGTAWEQAAELLGQALALWRGPALDGISLDACRADVARLDERRLTVLHQRIDAELRAGRHASLVGELESLTRAHPLRERFWAQLMTALHGADRQAEALAAFQRVRGILVDQLGVEPGAALQRLHGEILAGAAPGETRRPRDEAARPVPAQLPPATTAFTGREEHFEELDRVAADASGSTALAVVSGTAGVGKTALAVHWAHRVRHRFGDGQLYVDLRGYASAPPMRPIEALARFLQALGVPAEHVPVEPDQAAGLWRSLLADKRMLVVLDNAHSAGQVRPLLPGSAGCVVLVTSRSRLAGIVAREGAHPLTLDVLGHQEAVALLGRLLGDERVRAEAAETARLAERCGRLPLALRIAAADLRCRPGRRIADQVADLAGAGPLDALQIEDDEESAVRAAFALSYQAVDEPARRLFRRLGLVPGQDFTVPAAAVLAECSAADARRRLDRLTGTHLVGQDGDRYHLHDLLRLYAAERAGAEEDAGQRAAAVRRLGEWYLRTADAAGKLLYPTAVRLEPFASEGPPVAFSGHTEALSWLDAEIGNLVAAIRHCAGHRLERIAWLLADTLRGYFMLRVLPVEWATAAETAWAAAVTADDPKAQMAAQLSLAGLHMRQSRFTEAIEHYHRALVIDERARWPQGESTALGNLGAVYLSSGRLREAAEHFARALEADRRTGWRGGQASKLGNLGIVDLELGRLGQAATHLREALALFTELGSSHGEALAMANLGAVLHLLGDYPEAVDLLTCAAKLHCELGDRGTEADDRIVLAEVHRDIGDLGQALRLADGALTRAVEVGERHFEADALNVIGSIRLRLGDGKAAEDHHRRALELAERTDLRLPKVVALIGLAEARRRLGEAAQALRHAREAAALSEVAGFRVHRGQAMVAQANALTDLGRPAAAAHQAARALDVQRTTGHRLGAAHAQLALARALARSDPGAAAVHRWQARLVLAALGCS